ISASMDWPMMCAMCSGEGPRPSGPSDSWAGQPILASWIITGSVLGPPAAGRQPVDALLDDPHRLLDLVHPDQVAAVRVAHVVDRHLELVGLVAAVRLGLAQVPGQPGRPQD